MKKAPKKTEAIKKRLNSHLDMVDKLKALQVELEYAKEQYDTCKGPKYDGMPGGGKDKGTSETELKVRRKIELEEKVESKQSEINKDWAELEPLVESLSPFEALVTNLRYKYGEEWEDVCRTIFGKRSDYDIELDRYKDKMFKAHGRALLTLAKMIST
jgi:hypothetical protein